jgi:hypothetical protein
VQGFDMNISGTTYLYTFWYHFHDFIMVAVPINLNISLVKDYYEIAETFRKKVR